MKFSRLKNSLSAIIEKREITTLKENLEKKTEAEINNAYIAQIKNESKNFSFIEILYEQI